MHTNFKKIIPVVFSEKIVIMTIFSGINFFANNAFAGIGGYSIFRLRNLQHIDVSDFLVDLQFYSEESHDLNNVWQLINHSSLRRRATLKPKKVSQICRSSTYDMLSRYREAREHFYILGLEQFDERVLSNCGDREVGKLFNRLSDLNFPQYRFQLST